MKKIFFVPAVVILLATGCNKTASTPQDSPASQQPTRSAEGEKTGSEFLRTLGEPAPVGYKWTYQYDWDGIILSKSLRNANGQDLPIEPAVLAKFQNMQLPAGYRWTFGQTTPPQGGENITSQLGIRNPFACFYGKIPNKQECINPK